MIWQFGELGYSVSIDSGGRTSPKPIRWNYFKEIDRYRLFLIYKIINQLRKTQSVFSTNDYSYSLGSMQKRLTLNSTGIKVNILGNFDVVSGNILPGFPQTGKWYDYFKDDSITVSGVNDPINLQPGEYRLYTTVRLKSPKNLLGINDHRADNRTSFVHVYPNPSQREFTIEVEYLPPSPVTISFLDSSGRMIRHLKSEISTRDRQLFIWDGKTEGGSYAGKGMYFIQVQVPGRSETVKVIRE
jgi:hypothetical protein